MTQNRRQSNPAQLRTSKRNPAQQRLRTLLVLGLPVLLIVAVATLLYGRSRQQTVSLTAADQQFLIREDSPSLGPVDARVTVVEFLDPECEACRAAHPQVEQLLDEYDGRIRYVVRYFPNHNNSILAVAATEAAGEQGKYWEMQSALFANQLEWGERNTAQTEHFIRYAEGLGLDMERFTAGLQNPAYVEKAERDRSDALRLAVRGTPTFFVNGEPVFGMNYTTLKSLVDEALQS